jgi:CubicO group peptidase (beta-lactamase class C family)
VCAGRLTGLPIDTEEFAMPRLFALLLASVLALPPQASASAASDADKVRAVLANSHGAEAPGCAVGLFEDGKTAFVTAGSADIAHKRAADADTLFYSGSLAKQFTALAVAQLVVAGKLSLDDDVRKVLPEMALTSPTTTVGMLLHHTAGVPNSAKLIPLAGHEHVSEATRAETLAILLKYPNRAFPPGTTFEYSNGGYLLLSLIVERVSGVPFEDYIEDSILKPMGMTRSSVLRGKLPDDPNMAHGYMPQGDGFVLSEDFPKFGGAGAMMLTINDLAKYHHDITVGHRVWTLAVSRFMTQEARYADGSPVIQPVPGYYFGYASGLMLSRDWVLHGGNYAGFQALIAWLPGTTQGIAMLCNEGDFQPPKLATQIYAAIRPGLPAVDGPRYALPKPPGRYLSDDIAAVYSIAMSGEDLKVSVSSPKGEPRSVEDFRRVGDGVYAHGALALTFDPDRRGFTLGNGSTSARFHRDLQ